MEKYIGTNIYATTANGQLDGDAGCSHLSVLRLLFCGVYYYRFNLDDCKLKVKLSI